MYLFFQDICNGNAKLNLAFVANLFNNYPALDPADLEDIEIEPYEESREEKSKATTHHFFCTDNISTVLFCGWCLHKVYLFHCIISKMFHDSELIVLIEVTIRYIGLQAINYNWLVQCSAFQLIEIG